MIRQRLVPAFCALTLLTGGFFVPPLQMPAQAADLQQYERKYISFYPADHRQFNAPLMAGIKQDLPRFDYQNLDVPEGSNLQAFMQQVFRYQKEHAGELAARKELPDMRFGDKVVSWQETLKIMNAAFVMVPHWHFGKLELTHLHQPSKSSSWYVDLSSDLQLSLQIYRLKDGQVEPYSELSEDWTISKEMPIRNLNSILDSIKDATGGLAEPDNPLVEPVLLKALAELSPFKEALAASPESQLGAEAVKELQGDSYAGLLKSIKQLNAFRLKNQIEDVLSDRDRVQVTLGAGETASSLGAELDQGFKVVEYEDLDGQEKTREIGYVKLREKDKENLYLQPIIAQRELELGDQLIEYPLMGTNLALFGGTAAVGLEGDEENQYAPQAGLRLEFSLAKALQVSELYGLFSAGVGLPLSSQQNLSGLSGVSVDPDAFALPVSLELGLLKRWYVRQWILEAGVQGGGLFGLLMNSGLDDSPTTLSPGLTAFLGTGWQLSPDFLLELQGGWRFFLPGTWQSGNDSGKINVAYPGLSANGPVLQLHGSFSF